MGCFLIAAILGLFVHASNTDDINAKLGIKRGHWLKNVTAKDAHEAPVDKGAALACVGLPVLWSCSPNVPSPQLCMSLHLAQPQSCICGMTADTTGLKFLLHV